MDDSKEHRARPVAADGFITYASFATVPGNTSGGWQIGQCEQIDPAQAEELATLAPVQLLSEEPAPRYVDDVSRRELVRRTLWTRAPGDTGDYVLVHSSPAGTDASGRSGNVFSSLYLFAAGTPKEVRPAELIASPSLLIPYNNEVNLQRVENRGLTPNPRLTPARALDTLLAAHGPTHLRDLLATALDGLALSRRVVIGDDPDRAGDWLTLLTYALDPASARALTWSTYERAAHFRSAGPGGGPFDLAFTPVADIPELQKEFRDLVALDTRVGVRRDPAGGPTTYGEPGRHHLPSHPISALLTFLFTTGGGVHQLEEEPVAEGQPGDKLAALALSQPEQALTVVVDSLRQIATQRTPGGDLDRIIAVLPEAHRQQLSTPLPEGNVGEDTATATSSNPFASGSRSLGTPPATSAAQAPSPSSSSHSQPALVRVIRPDLVAALREAMKIGPDWVWRTNVRSEGWHISAWPDLTELLLASSSPGTDLTRLQEEILGSALACLIQEPRAQLEINWLPFWRLSRNTGLSRAAVVEHARNTLLRLTGRKGQTEELLAQARRVRADLPAGVLADLVAETEEFLREEHQKNSAPGYAVPYQGWQNTERISQEISPTDTAPPSAARSPQGPGPRPLGRWK